MADGSLRFNFPLPQLSRLRPGEIVVDLFAGGGGASEGLKQALGIDPALAYNHDEQAIGMHAANHPLTQHHREDIWHADPRVDVAGRKVGWFHASPDCTHFSQAKGGQPRSRKRRALSWVVLKWVGQLLEADKRTSSDTVPRIISMENVWQILTWGPLVAKRCKSTDRVLKTSSSSRTSDTAGAPGGSSCMRWNRWVMQWNGESWWPVTTAPAPVASACSCSLAATASRCTGPARHTARRTA
jgi:DNA (cytosine-5)-methyltransferase 1